MNVYTRRFFFFIIFWSNTRFHYLVDVDADVEHNFFLIVQNDLRVCVAHIVHVHVLLQVYTIYNRIFDSNETKGSVEVSRSNIKETEKMMWYGNNE